MRSQIVDHEELSFWQLVFSQSKVNGAKYTGEMLPVLTWNWPVDTYFQRRRGLQRPAYFSTLPDERMNMATEPLPS